MMEQEILADALRENYQSMLKMIGGSIELCPDTLWSAEYLKPRFWQEVYHALYYLAPSGELSAALPAT